MKPGEISPDSRYNESASRLISYGLVTAMMICAALALVSFIMRLIAGWQPWYLVVLVFFITLERLYTYRRFNRISLFSGEWLAANTTQWIVILIFIKLTIGLSSGIGAFLAEIPLWQVDFARYFLSSEVFFAIGVVVIVWVISGYYAELLDTLGLDQAYLQHEQPILTAGEEPARNRLLSLIFGTGTFLIILTGLMRLNLRDVLSNQANLSYDQLSVLEGGGASTLLYFMFALALLSQSQFIDLHARWSIQHIPVNREVAVRWARYSLGFLLLVAGMVSLLPTSYSLGVLSLLSYVLNILLGILFFIVQIVVGLLVFLFSLPLQLLGVTSPVQIAPVAQLPAAETPIDITTSPAWWEASKPVIFWIMLAGILLIALVMYLRQHSEILDELKKIRVWNFLAQFWKRLTDTLGNFKTSLGKVAEAAKKRFRTRRSSASEWFTAGFLNLRRLDPRQQVYFFYLALIRRSSESGLPRGLSQTPSEFASNLERALPDAEPDIDALTEAFIEARYTPRPVEPEKANLVKQYWERLKKALRVKK